MMQQHVAQQQVNLDVLSNKELRCAFGFFFLPVVIVTLSDSHAIPVRGAGGLLMFPTPPAFVVTGRCPAC